MSDTVPEQPTLPGLPEPERSEPSASDRSRGGAQPTSGARSTTTAVPVGATPIAEHLPVAQVCVDVTPLHLDRPFDYLVTEPMSADAQPGTRVKVRFGGQDVDGIILRRAETSSHTGKLVPIRRLVSAEIVLSEEVARLARAVADYYGGSLWDVLRLAIPPRHARTESAPRPATEQEPDAARAQVPTTGSSSAPIAASGASAWSGYIGGEAFLKHLQAGNAPRAVWTALPGDWTASQPGAKGSIPHPDAGWEAALVQVILAARGCGRGALIVLPDARDVGRLSDALEAHGLTPYGTRGGHFARLLAEDGAAARYRNYLAILRGDVQVVIGTRAAAFAPVKDLGVAVCWQDGESTHREPRAPHPHVREVLALRSELEDCAFLVGSVGRSAEAQALLASGWARELVAPRPLVRSRTPRVRVLDSVELAAEGPAAAARIPNPAWRVLRDALAWGPVLVQVPRRGYLPVLACQQCREAARCMACHGPLGLPHAGAALQCTWCGQLAAHWRCPECGGHRVRSVRVGSERTAEELGRAFPGTPVKVSGASSSGGVLDRVTGAPALVVATPGAEPVADGGYSAALLLDAMVLSAGMSLDSGHRALLQWLNAAGLVRAADAGGTVVIVGDGVPAVVNSVVRWDPAGFAERDLAERAELGLPPAVRVGAVSGDRAGVEAVLGHLELEPGWRVLGPVEVVTAPGRTGRTPRTDRSERADRADGEAGAAGSGHLVDLTGPPHLRAIISAPRSSGRALALALRAAAATRSLKRQGQAGQIELDPGELI